MSDAIRDSIERLVEMEIITGNLCRDDDGRWAGCDENQLKDMRRELERKLRKSDDDLCKERPKFCDDNLGISREDMPQLDGPVVIDFINSLRKSGVSIKRESIPVTELKPTQKEIDTKNALDKAKSFLKGKYPRIKDAVIVSREGNILDGHHRWAALRLVADVTKAQQRMNVIRVGMSIKQLVRRATNFKGVERRAMGEAQDIVLRAMIG